MKLISTVLKRWENFKYIYSNLVYMDNIVEITEWLKNMEFQNMLEVGCFPGHSTEYYKKNIKVKEMFAVDYMEKLLGRARAMGVDARVCDLEKQKLPFPDNYFDLVIANQIFEHLKNIFSPLSEIHRVLKPGGVLVFSVPNLASFHSRLLLLFGKSPTQIRLWGDHVRGFTKSELKPFLSYNGLFSVVAEKGVGYYPFPNILSRIMAMLFSNSTVYLTFFLKKTAVAGVANWEARIMDEEKASNFVSA